MKKFAIICAGWLFGALLMLGIARLLAGCSVEVQPKVTVQKVEVTLCLSASRTGEVSLVECDAGASIDPFLDASP